MGTDPLTGLRSARSKKSWMTGMRDEHRSRYNGQVLLVVVPMYDTSELRARTLEDKNDPTFGKILTSAPKLNSQTVILVLSGRLLTVISLCGSFSSLIFNPDLCLLTSWGIHRSLARRRAAAPKSKRHFRFNWSFPLGETAIAVEKRHHVHHKYIISHPA